MTHLWYRLLVPRYLDHFKTHKMSNTTAFTAILQFQVVADMEMKILFIAVLFIGACAGFYLPEEEEDALSEYEGQELEEMSNDEAETDLEDPSKPSKVPKCPKGKRAKCFTVKFCYRKLRICGCFSTKKYGDETEFDTQVNDEMQIATQDDEEEQFDENDQELEDPYYKKVDGNWGKWGAWSKCSKTCKKGKQTRKRKCNKPAPKYGGKDCKGKSSETRTCNEKVPCPVPRPRCKYPYVRRCFIVKDGKKWRILCACVRRCKYYGYFYG